jgi:hypothetical protein
MIPVGPRFYYCRAQLPSLNRNPRRLSAISPTIQHSGCDLRFLARPCRPREHPWLLLASYAPTALNELNLCD